ncbi:MAG: hypothetical protein E6R04_04665 [Spirochaetes bacterium]|nr:MAG: hypothetical protein E6R04_04665 [Spirochaetota bacterium]
MTDRLSQKTRRGKPRRAKGLAEVSTVRIDPKAKEILQREFGSLGGALYFVAVGIEKYRQRHGLATHGLEEDLAPWDPSRQGLSFPDLVRIRDVLWHRIDAWRGPEKDVAPDRGLLRLIEGLLGASGLFRDLPPIPDLHPPKPPPKPPNGPLIGVETKYYPPDPEEPGAQWKTDGRKRKRSPEADRWILKRLDRELREYGLRAVPVESPNDSAGIPATLAAARAKD